MGLGLSGQMLSKILLPDMMELPSKSNIRRIAMDGLTQTDLPGLTSGSGSRGHIAKERDESLRHSWMCKDCVT